MRNYLHTRGVNSAMQALGVSHLTHHVCAPASLDIPFVRGDEDGFGILGSALLIRVSVASRAKVTDPR